jgi:SAM-dependent methyltransferase
MMTGYDNASRSQPRRSLWLWDRLSSHGASAERMSEPIRRLALEHLELKAGEAVLDIGCGTGPNFESLRAAVGPEGRVVGVDFSPKMILHAQERIRAHDWKNVEVICADASRAGFEPAAYDAAIATSSLSAITDMPAAVEHVYGALQPGGRFFVFDLRLIPSGRVGPVIWLLGVVYKLLAGWSGQDVLTQLRATFPLVELVLPLRPWPPVVLALARKVEDKAASR